MIHQTLGRTGLRVSEIALGTAEIGMPYGIGVASRPDSAEAADLLRLALDLGINYIDTARAYGESESMIGEALRGRRHEYILASKVVIASRDQILRSVQQSLRALHTDVVDVMMLHSASLADIQSGEAVCTLLDLQRQGAIRFVGASVYGNEAAEAAVDAGYYDCLQVAYSVLDRRPEADLAGRCAQAGVGLMARSVLLKGALTDRSRLLPPDLRAVQDGAERMRRIAREAGCTLPELAYRYVLSTGTVQSALVGASNRDEVAQAVRFAESGPLPAALLNRIRVAPPVNEWYLNPGHWPPT